MVSVMYAVSKEDAAAIRAAFEQGGEFAAAVELRRRFPLIQDIATARLQARTIAGWQTLSVPPAADNVVKFRTRKAL